VTATELGDLRCTAQARLLGPDPVGSAGAAAAVLLVEVPLPWPSDVGEAVPAVASAASDVGARLQAVVPDPDRRARGEALVVLYRTPGDGFRGYERYAAVAPADGVPDAVRALAVSDAPTPGDDVLICTHGARDRCCGSLGVTLHGSLRLPPGVQAHRTSHLGGHRFAPTALLLPSGTAWAWLDHTLLGAIVERRVPPASVMAHYRGSLGMGHPALQVAEAAAFAEVGWAWLDHTRQGWCEADGDPDRWRVGIDGTAGAWRAVVERTGTERQPVCGRPLDAATKSDDRFRLVSAGWA
jgi:hypothetical protein